MRSQLIDWLALRRELLFILSFNVVLIFLTVVQVEPDPIKVHPIIIHTL